MTNWTNGEHAMALKAERERVQREMSIELADWQASSEAYRLDAETKAAEVERLTGESSLWEDRYNHRSEGDGMEIERLRALVADVLDIGSIIAGLAGGDVLAEYIRATGEARAALEPKP